MNSLSCTLLIFFLFLLFSYYHHFTLYITLFDLLIGARFGLRTLKEIGKKNVVMNIRDHIVEPIELSLFLR
ncbi:hypothetical protein BDV34DRAFT_196306 [Aspergillus parasiticus]|uniref:Uncharacterized protein n=1 Tax=Aspergillus parasiticus TaxID=5067 RepID=A0A5N6DIQ8_ASPPA|nr:hypothetical protein BDV34DRAFT_196306 [Aspergillus parasiticus]